MNLQRVNFQLVTNDFSTSNKQRVNSNESRATGVKLHLKIYYPSSKHLCISNIYFFAFIGEVLIDQFFLFAEFSEIDRFWLCFTNWDNAIKKTSKF